MWGVGTKPQGLRLLGLKKTLGVAQTYPLFEKSGAKTFIENRGVTV
ncbi:MAG: hypothetical protein PHG19_06655 [Anaerotignum sp.]|nr:hypothetical protein [Anaerotignum sp.]